MSKLENNLEKFKDVLDPITKGMSYSKKSFINKLFAEIITEVNLLEWEMNKAKANASGFCDPNEYLDSLHKAIRLLQAVGFTSIDFNTMRKDIIDWVIDNGASMRKELTAKTFTSTYKWVNNFYIFNERLPENVVELRCFIEEVQND